MRLIEKDDRPPLPEEDRSMKKSKMIVQGENPGDMNTECVLEEGPTLLIDPTSHDQPSNTSPTAKAMGVVPNAANSPNDESDFGGTNCCHLS